MSGTLLFIILTIAGLMVVGIAMLMLRRSWGGSLDRSPWAPPARTPASQGVMAEVRALAAAGNKIAAIKLYRELTGAGLKEAKDAVEALDA